MGLFRRSNITEKDAFPHGEVGDVMSLAHHGFLRSELDEPDDMPEAFEHLVERAAKARHRFEVGDITKLELARILSELRVVGPDGVEWCRGATSGRWYQRPPGGTWIPALPPSASEHGHVAATPTGNSMPGTARVDDPLSDLDDIDAFLSEGYSFDSEIADARESVAPVAELHDVTDQASGEALPETRTRTPVIDDAGVWDDTWQATARDASQTEGSTASAASDDLDDRAGLDDLLAALDAGEVAVDVPEDVKGSVSGEAPAVVEGTPGGLLGNVGWDDLLGSDAEPEGATGEILGGNAAAWGVPSQTDETADERARIPVETAPVEDTGFEDPDDPLAGIDLSLFLDELGPETAAAPSQDESTPLDQRDVEQPSAGQPPAGPFGGPAPI